MSEYSWITDEMFDEALMKIVDEQGIDSLIRIEGVYELVKEHYYNAVLGKLLLSMPVMPLSQYLVEKTGSDDEESRDNYVELARKVGFFTHNGKGERI